MNKKINRIEVRQTAQEKLPFEMSRIAAFSLRQHILYRKR